MAKYTAVKSQAASKEARVPASLEALFQWSLYGLVVCGFGALAFTGRVDAATVIAVATALVLRAALVLANKRVEIPESYSSAIAVIYIAVFFTDLFLVSREYVAATVHLVLFATVVKVYSVKRERDYLYLAVLAFLQVLAASVLTIDSVFLVGFALFVGCAVLAFLSLEVRRSYLQAESTGASVFRSASLPGSSILRVSLALVLGILIFASALFFVLPRRFGGYMSSLARSNQLSSGFSESVDLGAIGEIQLSDEVVMHVRVFNDAVPMESVHWRGITLASFDGKRWFNSPDSAPRAQGSEEGRFNLSASPGPWSDRATHFATSRAELQFRYRVSLEPLGSDVIFMPAQPELLDAGFHVVERDFGLSVFNRDRGRGITTYTGVSDLSRAGKPDLAKADGAYPAEVRERYLQLPQLDNRIARLAKTISSDGKSSYEKALSIEKYLQTEYSYTLQLPKESGGDRLADFLFTRRAGHCEYFASSMAVMLRTMGIPSRIVNGFRGAEFNDITGNYIIRARHAHSWVEAYFPGFGWTEFDPTPAAGDAYAKAPSRIFLYFDAAREFWREWVVNYDFSRQQQLGEMAANTGQHWFERTKQWGRSRYQKLLDSASAWVEWTSESKQSARVAVLCGAVLMLIIACVPFVIKMIRTRRVVRRADVAPSQAAALWYQRMLKTVERRGWRKSPSQTPKEFAGSISEPKLRHSVARFTDCYERARFGLSGEAATQLASRYEEVAAANERC